MGRICEVSSATVGRAERVNHITLLCLMHEYTETLLMFYSAYKDRAAAALRWMWKNLISWTSVWFPPSLIWVTGGVRNDIQPKLLCAPGDPTLQNVDGWMIFKGVRDSKRCPFLSRHLEALMCICVCKLPWGRSCIEHYRSLKRQCVFSHDELLFEIASAPTTVDIKLAECLVDDLSVVIEHEKHLRADLLSQVNCSC